MAASDALRFSRRRLMRAVAVGGAGAVLPGSPARAASAAAPQAEPPARRPGQRSVFGLKHPPMAKVRIGIIGVGGRGSSLLGNLLDIDNVEIRALCDIVAKRVEAAGKRVTARGRPAPAAFTAGETDFENLCKRDDVDVVYVATPWQWHVPMALAAMNAGKDAAVEVPAAVTLEECWQLVDTAERTGCHCIMLENCCYGEVEMLVLSMVRQGVLGELTHGEAGYLHSLADFLLSPDDAAVWRRRFASAMNGNLYPTHGLGPVAQYMGIHGGDRFERLVSMSSLEHSLSLLRDRLPAGDPRRSEKFVCGDVNTSLIRTALGRTIMVQFDITTPRPYSRINMIAGAEGTFCDYPPRLFLRGKGDAWETDLAPYFQKYGHPLWKKMKESALKSGGHGGMDWLMNWRLVQCLLGGTPLDMTVYDAAAWSAVFPLSVASVARGNAPVPFPDFTRGQWKTEKPLGIVGA
jgi:predicted dehydrogenase